MNTQRGLIGLLGLSAVLALAATEYPVAVWRSDNGATVGSLSASGDLTVKGKVIAGKAEEWNLTNSTFTAQSNDPAQGNYLLFDTLYDSAGNVVTSLPASFGLSASGSFSTTFTALTNGLWSFTVKASLLPTCTNLVKVRIDAPDLVDGGTTFCSIYTPYRGDLDCVDCLPLMAGQTVKISTTTYGSFDPYVNLVQVRITRVH